MSKAKKNNKKQAYKAKEESKTHAHKQETNVPAAVDAKMTSLEKVTPPPLEGDFALKKMAELKDKLETLKKNVMGKFSEYILGISILPPKKDETDLNRVDIAVLIDDTDSKTMSKFELREKLYAIMQNMAKEIDKNINPEPLLLSELWQNCYDAKYDLLELVSASASIFDKGMLASIKIAELHKKMVLKKFEKYIVSYVLIGSQVRGKAEPTSDIDVFIVIDDTDVKKMTRIELRDKLRAIIIGMGFDAGQITGIQNKINIQIYILTDFWDFVKEANPIIFTMLRDGVPFYDRGMYMPWKQLLLMGRIKPSQEAIDMYSNTGKQMIERIKFSLKNICVEDIFYAVLTPTQAALMLYGVNPPTHKEAADAMREVFVKKEKLLEESYVKILENIVKLRKDVEHGTRKEEIKGADIDRLLADTEKYLERLKKLFEQIKVKKEEEGVISNYENAITAARDVLRLEGIDRIKDTDVVKTFETEAVNKGLVPQKHLRLLKDIIKAKESYEAKKITKQEIDEVQKSAKEFLKFMVEHIQRKRGRELEKTRIRVKHGKKFGEVTLLDKEAFIIEDIDAETKEITRGDLTPDGAIKNIKKSSMEEFEKALSKIEIPMKVFVKEPIFEDLKKIFGKDVEVLINY
ncbi:MAG: nucleotidyltransferase domain-containing protein [Candidatus Woesearchaeota archaeon]